MFDTKGIMQGFDAELRLHKNLYRVEKYYEYFKNNQYLCVCCCGTWFFCEHRYLGCRVISQTIWD